MKLKYGFFAKDLIQDKLRNTWSAIHIFDEVSVKDFSKESPEFFALLNLEHEDGEKIRLVIKKEGLEDTLIDQSTELWRQGGTTGTNLSVSLAGLKFPSAGRYAMSILSEAGEEIDTLKLLVKQA